MKGHFTKAFLTPDKPLAPTRELWKGLVIQVEDMLSAILELPRGEQ